MNQPHRAFILTLDPLHIGSGGYRLSRVDLPIIREPATQLPKIPGTSLSGAARSYAALLLNGRQIVNGKRTIKCAGQRDHCGKCAVCCTFGAMRPKAKDAPEGSDEAEKNRPKEMAFAGMVNFFDAHLAFFPVASMLGPVWATSPSALQNAGFPAAVNPGDDIALVTRKWPLGHLNLGWMLLRTQETPPLEPPADLGSAWTAIKDRVVVLPDWLFAQIVNMNLEVRTSVSINPSTGAAEEGALFTYEAIPRGAWLCMEMGENQYRDLPDTGKLGWTSPLQVAWAGLTLAEQLGIGGMGTRGFGRIRLLDDKPKGVE